MTFSAAARKWNVDRTTVKRLQKNPHGSLRRPLQVLKRDEEQQLASWVNECAARGYPRARADIIAEAHEMLKMREGENSKIPSYDWLRLFAQRQNLIFRKAASVTKAGANVTEADIRAHFLRIEEGLKKEKCEDLLLRPERILNADESFFVLNPVSEEVCFQKGVKHAQRIVVDEKAGITVMLTVRADGKKMKPFFVYPQLRISASIDSAFPGDRATRTATESGWMNSDAFCTFLREISAELMKEGLDMPAEKALLFVDNHGSHLKVECCELAKQLGIVMVSLYPNTTHLTQPCDVSCFRSLKAAWRAKAAEFKRRKMEASITKVTIARLLVGVVENLQTELVIRGFRKAGMYPWDSSAVDYSKCIAKAPTLTFNDFSSAINDESTPEDAAVTPEASEVVSATVEASGDVYLDLSDTSNSAIVSEENLLALMSGQLPHEMVLTIAQELAREKLLAIYSTAAHAIEVQPEMPAPERGEITPTMPITPTPEASTPAILALPPRPRRQNKRITKRTSPILSGEENVNSLKEKVFQADIAAVGKQERALKTAGNQKRKALELLGKSEANAKKAGLVSTPVSGFQSPIVAGSPVSQFSSSLYQESISFDFIQPRSLSWFNSTSDFSDIATTITIDEPPAKVAKIVPELVKRGRGRPKKVIM